MSTAIAAAIVDQLHHLDEQRQAQVLEFMVFLAAKYHATTQIVGLPPINRSIDLSKYVGTVPGFPDDGVAYQRQIRDTEWP